MHRNFLTMILISLFSCCKKVFILIDIWMIGKNSMKHRYILEKEDFYSHLNMEDIIDAGYAHAKRF